MAINDQIVYRNKTVAGMYVLLVINYEFITTGRDRVHASHVLDSNGHMYC